MQQPMQQPMQRSQSLNLAYDSSQFNALSGRSAARVAYSEQYTRSNPYNWKEPNDGFMATVFPSDATWHTLYNHSRSEIYNAILRARQYNPALEPKIIKTVEDSYYVATMGVFYKALIVSCIILIFFIALSISSSANPPPDSGCDPLDPTCPIDGGVSVLVAIGIGLGYKKSIKKK